MIMSWSSIIHIQARAQKKKLNELELEPIKLDELASSSTHLQP